MAKTCNNAVFTFGRFNPPTIGHQKLVDKIKSIPGDHYIFLSHTVNTKTDPLAYDVKRRFVELFFKDITVGDPDIRTIIQVLQNLQSLGYVSVTMVVGSDRVESFASLLQQYNGKEYVFESVTVTSAGVRDPDGDTVSSISASAQREAVKQHNYKKFTIGVPNAKYSIELFDAVQQGMTK
jgi:nicotinic acid mononucleotide adenylyltransferase